MTLLARLVQASDRVAGSSSRLAKVRELATCLAALDREEVRIGVQYLSGETPQGRIGIGYALIRNAGKGEPAATPSLTIADVDAALTQLARIRGAGSAAARADALAALFARATQAERSFLARLLLGELRQGALAGVMADAIAAAAGMPVAEVRRATMYADDLGAVAAAALGGGDEALAAFQLQTGRPIAPMLAQTAESAAAALRALGGEAAFEWKLDGARIQAHKSGETVRLFTRNGNEVGGAVPEIVERVASLPARELVLDGEAIACDANERPHPFQVTMRRFGRKLDVARLREALPMRAFFFDCLRLEGGTLADRPAHERIAAMEKVLPQELRVPRIVTTSEDEAQAFYDAALAAGHEGVMAKALEAPYEAGNRGAGWLKVKRAHTLDLVVLAAEWGHGRRQGWLSNLHLGAFDADTGEWVMLGKTFKGLTDEMLEWQTKALLERETRREGGTVYVRPELVVEIAYSDLQASPRYLGGLALRLARVKGWRTDKDASQADTMGTVRRLYASQSTGEARP